MINATAKHDKPDPLPTLQALMGTHMAHYPARQITGHMHQRMVATFIISNSNQVAFVILAGVITESESKLTLRVFNGSHLT
jgi:hypothetical protein